MTVDNNLLQHGTFAITITPDHPDLSYKMPLDLLPILVKAYKKVSQNSKSAQKQLEHWMVDNPKVPQFKDLLAARYLIKGEREKARRLYSELVQDHPGYVQARTALASMALTDHKPDLVKDFLGPALSLAALYPERKVFHFDEYATFARVLLDYYCEQGEAEKARSVLDDLKEVAGHLGVEDDFALEEELLLLADLPAAKHGFFGVSEDTHDERGIPTLPQTTEAPHFRLPQTIQLYQHSFTTMPDEMIHELLASDRELLRLDLEDVLRDAIQRYNYFAESAEAFDSYDAPLHALFLLKEIGAEESLPVVLELLRQPEEVLHFWLGDTLTEDLRSVLYTLGFHHLPQLAAFIKEPLNYTYARAEVSVTLQQVALHHPEHRAEVLALYKDLLAFFVAHANDPQVLDPTLVAFVATNVADMHATELLPDLKTFYDADLVDQSVSGDFRDLKELMNSHEDCKWPVNGYFEMKEELARLEESWPVKEQPDPSTFPRQSPNEMAYDDSVEWEEVDEAPAGTVYSGDTPFIMKDPKIGRNDPCYCGSGKKYKHCHGKS